MKYLFGNYRSIALALAAGALFAINAGLYATQETVTSTQETATATHDGTLVSVTADKLVMTSLDGKEHSHMLVADAKLSLDGKTCPWANLKPGTKIRVTTQGADQATATRIEAIDKNLAFASDRHDGKFVSMTGEKLVMTGMDGKEHAHMVNKDAKLTLDGKPCKAADLKSGIRIRVTTRDAYTTAATRIEALDQNQEFASDQNDGTIIRITGNKLVMTGMDGNGEHSCTLSPDVKISLDGKVVKSTDLKPGMKIRVTSQSTDANVATRVEALAKNLEFTSTF